MSYLKQGKVYLVGAGPGDPGLITKKGLELLQQAQVIVYDHLVDITQLECASPTAEKIYAGKSGSRHAMEQSEINDLLVAKAQEGKTVVRLKGGDPFVLGRGGEEAEALVANRVAFEVVPGVSSAIAAPAYAGIPVTHREAASSFAVITGHEDPHKASSSIRWDKIATGVDTLIFLMGMQNLKSISEQLIKYGRPAATPVAVIKNGTSPEQQTLTGTLQDIAEKVAGAGLGPPAVIVVGEVVRLREKLRWFDNRPLAGKRILVTRSRRQASELSRLLAEAGARPVELPAIDIRSISDHRELDAAIQNLADHRWIIFTSVNGVAAFFERLQTQRLDSRALNGIRVGAIGPATARALEEKGVRPDYCPDVFTSQGLLDGLKGTDLTGQAVLLPRADIADKELVDGLKKLGADVHEVAVYQTVPSTADIQQAREMLANGEIDVVTFTSSSTVSNLTAALDNAPEVLNCVKVACIGPKTAAAAEKAGLKVNIQAKESTIPGLVDAIKEYYL
jgi:uroporphyrinogen III methyltransferase/synthase